MEGSETRQKVVSEIVDRTDISEQIIERLVHTFYDRIRGDDLLGPIFNERVSDWDAHLKRMCAFWSSVMLMTGRYSGQPMAMHQVLPVTAEHFDRWLEIFCQTSREVCSPAGSDLFIVRARRIAESLELGVAFHQGRLSLRT